jgi:ATP-dependent Clp protease ATP-binding subunit ClpA
VFERFTDRARRVVVLAQEEARELNHNYIGTEHLLLGIVRDGEGVGAMALQALDVSLGDVRRQVIEIVGVGSQTPSGHVPFTPRGKKVLELALREALQMGHDYIGTEHIVLGLVREEEGVAAQVLVRQGLTLEAVREQVLRQLSEISGEQVEATAQGEPHPMPPGFGAGGWVPGRRPMWWSHRRRRGTSGRHPVCLGCGAPLTETAAYRTHPVQQQDGDGVLEVVFVFCTACGATIAGQLAPRDLPDETGAGR